MTVTVTKEVAETIEALRKYGYSNAQIVYEMEKGGLLQEPLDSYFNEAPRTTDDLLSALVNGYEVGKTREDNLREYYSLLSDGTWEQDVVVNTLEILGIKIEGVNE